MMIKGRRCWKNLQTAGENHAGKMQIFYRSRAGNRSIFFEENQYIDLKYGYFWWNRMVGKPVKDFFSAGGIGSVGLR